MKYRIIIGESTAYPYKVEMKRSIWSSWQEIDRSRNLPEAEHALKEYIKANIPPLGTILKIYEESDILVEKLKGTI